MQTSSLQCSLKLNSHAIINPTTAEFRSKAHAGALTDHVQVRELAVLIEKLRIAINEAHLHCASENFVSIFNEDAESEGDTDRRQFNLYGRSFRQVCAKASRLDRKRLCSVKQYAAGVFNAALRLLADDDQQTHVATQQCVIGWHQN